MSECPFCSADVPSSLVVYGGTCPQCFAEIPGEEAATDPGDEVKAQLAASDEKRAKRRNMLPLLFGTPVVLALVAVAAWQFWPQGPVEPLVFDEGEFEIDVSSLAKYTEPEPEPEPEPKKVASAPKSQPAARRPAQASATPDLIDAAAPPSAPKQDGFGVALTARRTAALLTNRDDIQSAVRDLFGSRAARLQLCYERSLKSQPELRGKWRLSFTIDKGGKVVQAKAEGMEMTDDALDACIEREMGTWSIYGRLEKPWPVSLPINFKGRG